MAMICPECGNEIKCLKTLPDGETGTVARHRYCEHCDQWYKTEEYVTQKIIKLKRRAATLRQY